ncbi:hypothetical protein L915_19178 [Phytophthora nicotianae]|uniref:Uncharacterized protein n=1 Tax=Phytophthora nicotianae TaxID=4792 RepID=W2I1M0_PHYNI|nr:hypothetical protein L915_19178 [Phytophthora nicotianae]ETL27377.1 hypothetical protein L916_19067 [Phytophthora nicotianae]
MFNEMIPQIPHKRLLDAVPKARITKDRLIEAAVLGDDAGEAERVLPTGTDLSGQPTYQMQTILADRRINGRVQRQWHRVECAYVGAEAAAD